MKLLSGYTTKPAYLFGGLAFALLAVGALRATGVLIEWLTWDTWQHKMTVMMPPAR